MEQVEIVIIGAGAAGIGFGTALHLLGMDNFVILERGEVGESFLNWPEETRFITPSFTTNGFGFPDLNAVVPNTSPAFTFGKEHLSVAYRGRSGSVRRFITRKRLSCGDNSRDLCN